MTARQPLTPRQLAFVNALLDRDGSGTFGNATRAAEAVGYRWPNKQGPVVVHHPAVAAEINRRLKANRALRRALQETWGVVKFA